MLGDKSLTVLVTTHEKNSLKKKILTCLQIIKYNYYLIFYPSITSKDMSEIFSSDPVQFFESLGQ